jgi:hypothetical protein
VGCGKLARLHVGTFFHLQIPPANREKNGEPTSGLEPLT